jgi:methanogenic corrinoid protein MtbC1
MSDLPVVEQDDLARYWSAVSRADDDEAVAGALALRNRGVPLEQILNGLVVATQLRVGELWADNAWSVAREHAATAIAEHVVARLAEDLPEPTTGPVHLVACVEREWHALPALVVATALRSEGHRVDYLGASVPRDRLVARISERAPDVVLLSASMTSSLVRVRREIEAVRETGTPVLVGGHAFDAEGLRARRLGATGFAPSVDEAIAQLRRLPTRVIAALPLVHPAALEAAELTGHIDELARDVMSATDHALGVTGGGEDALPPDDWRVVLATFVPHVVESVVGALLTDDPRVMAETRAWLAGVLIRRGADPRAVPTLDRALVECLREHPEALRILAA